MTAVISFQAIHLPQLECRVKKKKTPDASKKIKKQSSNRSNNQAHRIHKEKVSLRRRHLMFACRALLIIEVIIILFVQSIYETEPRPKLSDSPDGKWCRQPHDTKTSLQFHERNANDAHLLYSNTLVLCMRGHFTSFFFKAKI